MAFKYLTGPNINNVSRGQAYGATPTGPILCSASLDASYPLANLYNTISTLPVRLAAATTGAYFTFSNNLLVNGDMEQGSTAPVPGWTNYGTATLSIDATYPHKGSKALKIITGAQWTGAYQTVTVRAGEYLQLWAAARSDGTNDAYIILRCLETSQDLNSSGVWAAIGTANVMLKTAATMAAFTPVTFRAPTFAELGKATCTLQVILLGEGNGMTLYFDEVLLVPGIDALTVHGHGFDASTGVALFGGGANYWHSPSWDAELGTSANGACKSQTFALVGAQRYYNPFHAIFFYPGSAWGPMPRPSLRGSGS